jgi:hypothetical protein
MKNEEVVVVAFDSAGYISAVTSISPEYAQSTAKQLRKGGRSVKCMSREEFTALQEREAAERKSSISF